MDEWLNGRMDGQTDRWVYGWAGVGVGIRVNLCLSVCHDVSMPTGTSRRKYRCHRV